MRKELSQIELTELYLLGQMNEEDKLAFELKMQQDEELEEDVRLQALLMESIALSAFTAEMAAMHDRLAAPSGKSAFPKLFWYGLSGLLLLAGITALLLLNSNGNEEKEKANRASFYENETDEDDSHAEVLKAGNVYLAEKDSSADEPVYSRTNRNQKRTRVLKDNGSYVNMDRFLPVEHKVTMDADLDFTFQMADSKSFVHIPGKAMTNKSGGAVHGPVEIHYKEYRNSAQTAFSQLPMTYRERSVEYNFNSAGMFEIRAYQDGEELKLLPEKPMVVDYNVTQKPDNCFFWQLKNNEWIKKQQINFQNIAGFQQNNPDGEIIEKQDSTDQVNNESTVHSRMKKAGGKLIVNVRSTFGKDLEDVIIKKKDGDYRWTRLYNITYTDSGTVVNNMHYAAHELKLIKKGYRTLIIKDVRVREGEWTTIDAQLQPKRKKNVLAKAGSVFTSKGKDEKLKVKGSAIVNPHAGILPLLEKDSVSGKITTKRIAQPAQPKWTPPVETVKGNATLLGGPDAGHSYPDIVRGLNCPDFGVYNCDQIYRVQDQLAIRPEFLNEEGRKISNGKVLSMIDLNYNGAFSFDPKQFTCSGSGRNVLLLFTTNKKIYAIKEEEFSAMNIAKSGAYTFTMRDISAEVKDSKDLKKFLGLK